MLNLAPHLRLQQNVASFFTHRSRLVGVALSLGVFMFATMFASLGSAQESSPPNIIFVMADDLGYGDLGCYGQELIQTPNLDRMAHEGMRFTQFYAGSTVCAPSRSVLMTGQHAGHTFVRGNGGGTIQSLRPDDVTVAEVLKKAGYTTALCGKWGLGDALDGNTGLPNDQGFDLFFGYLNQRHAHNYYPEFLWLNKDKVELRNKVVGNGKGPGGFTAGYATERIDYSHDLIVEQAMEFVTDHHDEPFFLYLPLTIPHANNEGTRGTGNGQEVPDLAPYSDKDWSEQDKGQAAMITRMDRDMGRLFDLLKSLDIDDRTIVMFTSDNGPHDEGGHDTERFQPSGPLRGMKRNLTEGGIRVPFIVRWPGHVPANTTSDHIAYFGDIMATLADLTHVEPPANLDSISFLPTLLHGQEAEQEQHKYLYWEFYERGGKQAVRAGKWKAIRKPMIVGPVELYDLENDLDESDNVADQHPEVVQRLVAFMDEAHVPNDNWKPNANTLNKRAKKADGNR